MRLFTLLAVLILSLSCNNKETIQIEEVKEQFTLTGKAFKFTYFPANNSRTSAVAVASRMNQYKFSIYFDSDSTFYKKSTKYLTPGSWSLENDSLHIDKGVYSFNRVNESIFLQDSTFTIELTPIN